MSHNDYININKSEADIRQRLNLALHAEHLLVTQGPAAKRATEILDSQVAPAELLRQLAAENLLTVTPSNLERAAAEIADSVAGLSRARAGIHRRFGEANPTASFNDLIDRLHQRSHAALGDTGPSALLARFEQLVSDGHPASPAAKTSLGIGTHWPEVLPEHTETITLRFAAVEIQLAQRHGADTLQTLRDHLPQLGERLKSELATKGLDHHVIIPVHPFQWEEVIATEFHPEIDRGEVVLLDTTAIAEPLMSVRSLRVSDGEGAVHIKVALEVQLTGAVRGISAGAVAAPTIAETISHILDIDTGFNPRTSADTPAFDLARDLAAVRYRADTGLRAHCFGAVIRQDPATGLSDDEIAMPVASLLATNPLTGRPIMADIFRAVAAEQRESFIQQWFAQLGAILFVPAIALAARWGIALEPHPQNTVIVLRQGRPERIVIRDLGGCRIYTHGPLRDSALIDALGGTALLEDDLTRLVDKVFYPLVTNLYRNLLTLVPEKLHKPIHHRISELLANEYWRTHAAGLELEHDGHEVVFHRVLGTDLPVKRVLAMRLSGAVTEQDYCYEPNPLVAPQLLSQSYFRDLVQPWLPWARQEVERRLHQAAAEESVPLEQLESLRADIDNAVENLALVRARIATRVTEPPESFWQLLRGLPPHHATAMADSLAIAGHNVHPLAKLRRGFSLIESASFGPEAGSTIDLRFLAIHRDHLAFSKVEDSLGLEELSLAHFPEHLRTAREYLRRHTLAPGTTEADYAVLPVHPWQLRHIITSSFSAELAQGSIVVVPQLSLAVYPTVSLRTLIPHAPSARGARPFIKCALDVTLTSTRRSISQDSALGTPRVARQIVQALSQLRREAGVHPQAEVIPELAGVALARGGDDSKTRQRGLSVLLREDPARHLRAGEIAVSASALRGHCEALPSPLADINAEFFDDYSYDLIATVFAMMFHRGIALEQHLQNTMVRIDLSGPQPQYRGLLLRDFSGLRAFAPRIAGTPAATAFESGAITLTQDYQEFLNKGCYAAIFGNLDGIVEEYSRTHNIAPDTLWQRVREQFRRVLAQYQLPISDSDIAGICAPTISRKGFVSMALNPQGSDIYVQRRNPLALSDSPAPHRHQE